MKEHSTYWHWGDWFADEAIAQCHEATRGIWVDALGRMITAGTDRMDGIVSRLVASLRTSPEVLFVAVIDLAESGAAIVCLDDMPILEWRQRRAAQGLSELEFITNDLTKVRLTLVSRRLSRELESRKLHSTAGKIGMKNRWHPDNKSDNIPITPEHNGRDMVKGNGVGNGEGEKEEDAATKVFAALRLQALPVLKYMNQKRNLDVMITDGQLIPIMNILEAKAGTVEDCQAVAEYGHTRFWKSDQKGEPEKFNPNFLFSPKTFQNHLAEARRKGYGKKTVTGVAIRAAETKRESPPTPPPTAEQRAARKKMLADLLAGATDKLKVNQ